MEIKFKSFNLIDKIMKSINSQFPKKCSCGKEFKDFKEFIENTDLPSSQNLQIFDCTNLQELLSLRNCKNCKSTIAIKCVIDEIDKKVLLDLIKNDIKINNIDQDKFLQIFRNEVIKCMLNESDENKKNSNF